jgi:peptidoglycan hydrolase CwlO-like protein
MEDREMYWMNKEIEKLTAQVEDLYMQIENLKCENVQLKQIIEAIDKDEEYASFVKNMNKIRKNTSQGEM